jgi:hypothetical protein
MMESGLFCDIEELDINGIVTSSTAFDPSEFMNLDDFEEESNEKNKKAKQATVKQIKKGKLSKNVSTKSLKLLVLPNEVSLGTDAILLSIPCPNHRLCKFN